MALSCESKVDMLNAKVGDLVCIEEPGGVLREKNKHFFLVLDVVNTGFTADVIYWLWSAYENGKRLVHSRYIVGVLHI